MNVDSYIKYYENILSEGQCKEVLHIQNHICFIFRCSDKVGFNLVSSNVRLCMS